MVALTGCDTVDKQVVCADGYENINGLCKEEIESDPIICAVGYTLDGDNCELAVSANILIVETNLYLDEEPFFIQGVCWNPVNIGGLHPFDLDFLGNVEKDAKLMQEAGINTVRTYEPIVDVEVLDILLEHGIYVINTIYPSYGTSIDTVLNRVDKLKEHEAILMWALGNEWNYNGLYADLSLIDSRNKINEVATKIKEIDSTRPITTMYGNMPTKHTVDMMPSIDVWGLNVYSGDSFGTIFSSWGKISDKPMYISEYGADAWNSIIDATDEESQAYATRKLTDEILSQSQLVYPDNISIGGTIFSFSDEWWKDPSGSLDTQDNGGFAPGGGPYPDSVFNEEYWGIVDIYEFQEKLIMCSRNCTPIVN